MTDTDIVTRIVHSKDWNRLIGLLHVFAAKPHDSVGQIEARNKVTDLVKDFMTRCARETAEECAQIAAGTYEGGCSCDDDSSGFDYYGENSAEAIRAKFKEPT